MNMKSEQGRNGTTETSFVTYHRIIDANVTPPLWYRCSGESLQQAMLIIRGRASRSRWNRAYNRKENDNGRDDKPGVKSSSGDIVVLAPPAVEPFLDKMIEDQRHDPPGRERQRRRRWKPTHSSQHDRRVEVAAYPAQTPAIFDKGVENARKDRPDEPEDVEILVYGPSAKHPVRTDDSPDDRR